MLAGGCPLNQLVDNEHSHRIIKLAGGTDFINWCYSNKIVPGNFLKFITTLVEKEYYLFSISNINTIGLASIHYTQLHHIIVEDPF